MKIENISDLPASAKRAVIINVRTKWVTTLALLSALRYVQMPVLVIDCESNDGSLLHFENLMKDHEFDLLTAPLRQHGRTLDWLFKSISAENVLLLDSDTEILNRTILNIIDDTLDDDQAFGWGFVHGPEWMNSRQMGFQHENLGLYQERMWIPFSMLNTKKICEALDAGYSFIDRIIYNDFWFSQRISKLFYSRFYRRAFVRSRLKLLDPFRKTFYNAKPSYLYCDTGADVFQYLRYKRNYRFIGISAMAHEKYVSHFHGITRKILDPTDSNATATGDVFAKLCGRLREVYGVLPTNEIE